MKRIVAIIQARMTSQRLPGKVLMPIVGRPMLWHIVQRVSAVRGLSHVVVATSESPTDDAIRELGLKQATPLGLPQWFSGFCTTAALISSEARRSAKAVKPPTQGRWRGAPSLVPGLGRAHGFEVFSGSLNDVLDRYYQAARVYHADVVLRVTGDCPLFDPEIVGQMLDRFLTDGQLDHIGLACGAGVAGISGGGRFPDGLDAELTTFAALESAWREARQPLEREHVTPFIWRRPERFRVATHFSPVDYSQLRWTVDNLEDLEVVRASYEALYRPDRHFLMHDVLKFLTAHPEIGRRNQHFVGHEGYEKFWEAANEPCPASLKTRHVA